MHELDLELPVDPAALTTEAGARAAITPVVAARLAALPFLLASPVTLRVACPTRPVNAPGLVEYPNLAAWVAPLTDALAGAGRLLLSTSQVAAVTVTTAPPGAPAALLVAVTSSPPQRRLDKAELRLVEVGDGWCAPVPTGLGAIKTEAAVRRLTDTLAVAARRRPGPFQRGFLRRSELAPDIPVVTADRLVDLTAGVPAAL